MATPPYFVRLYRAEIGLGLTGMGILFTVIGIMLLFDKGFIAMGNMMFIAGLVLTIGAQATIKFFTRSRNYKG